MLAAVVVLGLIVAGLVCLGVWLALAVARLSHRQDVRAVGVQARLAALEADRNRPGLEEVQ